MVHAAPVQKDALSTLRCVLQTSWNLFIVFGADKECSEKKYRVCFKHYIYGYIINYNYKTYLTMTFMGYICYNLYNFYNPQIFSPSLSHWNFMYAAKNGAQRMLGPRVVRPMRLVRIPAKVKRGTQRGTPPKIVNVQIDCKLMYTNVFANCH
jgi:hypothetical protein